jgi:hypothetical protein
MPVLFGLLTIFKVLAGIINFLIKGMRSTGHPGAHPTALIYLTVIYLIPLILSPGWW